MGTIGLTLLLAAEPGPAPAGAGEGLEPPVGLGETGRGSLLVKTGDPARFQEAPLLKADIRMEVTGLVARVRVAQQFANPTEEWLEAIYLFPLPAAAAVDTLLVRVGPGVIEGPIPEREEARQASQARPERKTASFLEQGRPDIFTVLVANIGPGEQVEVVLQYQELLRYDSGELRLSFPVVVGPVTLPVPPPSQPTLRRDGESTRTPCLTPTRCCRAGPLGYVVEAEALDPSISPRWGASARRWAAASTGSSP
jgi:Ca-activated chloride channel family protein